MMIGGSKPVIAQKGNAGPGDSDSLLLNSWPSCRPNTISPGAFRARLVCSSLALSFLSLYHHRDSEHLFTARRPLCKRGGERTADTAPVSDTAPYAHSQASAAGLSLAFLGMSKSLLSELVAKLATNLHTYRQPSHRPPDSRPSALQI